MNGDNLRQRQQGADMIIERCKGLARELGVKLKSVGWKDDIEQERDTYTLVIHVGSAHDEIPLDHTELQAYPSRTSTAGTDTKLRSLIRKRPSGG